MRQLDLFGSVIIFRAITIYLSKHSTLTSGLPFQDISKYLKSTSSIIHYVSKFTLLSPSAASFVYGDVKILVLSSYFPSFFLFPVHVNNARSSLFLASSAIFHILENCRQFVTKKFCYFCLLIGSARRQLLCGSITKSKI